jgi:voltage-gated potassium channel
MLGDGIWGRDRALRILRSERRLEDRYMLSAVLIVMCILAFAFAADGAAGRVFVVGLQGVTLTVILRSSEAKPRTIRIAGFLTLLALIGTVFSAIAGGKVSEAGPGIIGALLALFGPIAIARRLVRQDAINFRTIAGAVCIYLLAGLFFALAFWTMGALETHGFFVQTDPGTPTDFVYYSFITMTTVGYGDFTALHDLGRLSSVVEALFGQLYLVSVIALLVSNVGRVRRSQ